MKYRVLIIFSLLLILFCAFLYGPSLVKSFSNSEIPKPNLVSEKLTTLVNEWRVKSGFQSYENSDGLCEIAGHRVKAGSDQHLGLYQNYSNYPSVIQENSTGGTSEQDSLNRWLNSPPHRATLEKPYKYSCISTQGNYAVQVFSNCEHGCPKERY